jgi:hypothetical protein
LIEHAPSTQQILESGVGAPSAEKLSYVVEVAGQELAGEVQRERLPEIVNSLLKILLRCWEIEPYRLSLLCAERCDLMESERALLL